METQDMLLVERRGHVATMTLNRPERLNALNFELFAQLIEQWPLLDADPTIRSIVFTGAGRAFCAGVDLSRPLAAGPADGGSGSGPDSMATGSGPPREGGIYGYTARQAQVYKPVITAVNGVCAGGGLHFVIDADIVIASESATFFDPHLNVGRVDALESVGLARKVGLGPAVRMMLLGSNERLTAQRALELGIVSEVVPDDQLMDRAIELAEAVATCAPLATQISLRNVWDSLNHGIDEALELSTKALRDYGGHPDEIEGAHAFMEKRTPQWTT
jgi:enoyl-CoA hydratase/carnithine racemase